jgi:hypothetical protein
MIDVLSLRGIITVFAALDVATGCRRLLRMPPQKTRDHTVVSPTGVKGSEYRDPNALIDEIPMAHKDIEVVMRDAAGPVEFCPRSGRSSDVKGDAVCRLDTSPIIIANISPFDVRRLCCGAEGSARVHR